MTQIKPTFKSLSSELCIASAKADAAGVVDSKSNKYLIAATEVHRIVRLAMANGICVDKLWRNVAAQRKLVSGLMH